MTDLIESSFDILDVTRNNILNLYKECTQLELLEIPKGFNNNILWNVGHILSVQDALIYSLSGVSGNLDKEFIKHFKKGSVANPNINTDVILGVESLIIETANSLKRDYRKGKFLEYNEFSTSYGYVLNSVDEAIIFNNIHESLHFGYILALRKSVQKGTN